MPNSIKDDVIRIRVDTARAVRDFLDMLAQQAAEGETRAPAKPRATAIYRELAPYRLVEYNYVAASVGEVAGAFIGLPDGTICSVTDEIPEAVIDAMVGGVVEVDSLAPIYVYVILESPAAPDDIDTFLTELSDHVGLPFVGVFRDGGAMVARFYAGENPIPAPEAMVARALTETALHLGKTQVLDRFVARSESPDGRAFARVAYGFAKHVTEFSSVADRDDFVAWSRQLSDALNQSDQGWEDFGFSEVFRPVEPQPEPSFGMAVTTLIAPRHYQGGKPWQAFDGEILADGKIAADYWYYVKSTIDANEADAERVDGWLLRGV